MASPPIAQGNDILVTREGRISNASMPSAFQFEQLVEKHKYAYKDQPTMKGQALMGHKILQELYSLDPPGHIWLELQETANVFHEVTNECQAAHICRIFLILAWHPLVCYDDSEDVDESTKFVEGANIDPKPMPLEQDHDLTAEPERRHRTRGGMHPVMGSVVVDFFATFNRIQNRASQAVSNQTDESELNK